MVCWPSRDRTVGSDAPTHQLKEKQVLCIEAVVRSVLDEMAVLVDKLRPTVADELVLALHLAAQNIDGLIACSRFGWKDPERMDTMLFGYLVEEGVNMEVAKGVLRATWSAEAARRNNGMRCIFD
ncbi:hypothetical protein BJ508DRAFT_419011, partial [Ascobolus immersus RN42]